MNVTTTEIEGVLLVEPKVFGDSRGFFLESYSLKRYREAGISQQFVQDNVSFSEKGVLRGLHFQNPNSQGKLVSAPFGAVFDVVVDIRLGSKTFGQWVGYELSADNGRQLWVPAGLAHGFVVLTERALFTYKCTEYYAPQCEHSLLWNDPDLGVNWPTSVVPKLSTKDQNGKKLSEIDRSILPRFEMSSL